MKTVSKINPEQEYEIAKEIIGLASIERLSQANLTTLDSSVENLMTAARVLMEREDIRRGKRNPPKENPQPKGRNKGDNRESSTKLPSERYPNIEIREVIVRPVNPPQCSCCNKTMKESGLFDTSEKLEVIPKTYYIERQKRVIFNCGNCHGGMTNTNAKPSIIPTSNYGDSLIIDASLTKYCDLIPMERYAAIAGRSGLMDLPPQSLIGLTHQLADFLMPIYDKIRKEVLASLVLLADETPHKMLEGDLSQNWFLWGFFCSHACYFEIKNTRSGDIATEFLKYSLAEYLLTDGYAGYGKAIREVEKESGRKIIEAFCNAHAIRYFKDSGKMWKEELESILKIYGQIYDLEAKKKLQPDRELQLELRQQMLPLFEKIKEEGKRILLHCMPKSTLQISINYFLNHYDGLTVCTKNIDVELDNNFSERSLRSPVIGKKTWLGTHSKRGALTNAVHFSLVQSCLVNKVNPRNYYPWIIERIQQNKEILTPYKYSQLKETQ